MNAVSTPTTLPPIECASWCEKGDGHTAAWHPDDQYCTSEERTVFLSRRPLVLVNDGTRQRDQLSAVLYRENGERSPHVDLVDESAFSQTSMTIAEARQHAAMVNALCDIAESDEAGPLTRRLALP